ncbi:MAG TPA: polyprenyl synthetase family protein [Spirochaetia bacterium]|nr:polyprenyl synthetase family protein [Spirochaetia bacterium]
MPSFLQEYRGDIESALRNIIESQAGNLSRVNQWGKDVCGRLTDFACSGKMIRGALTLHSARMFKFSRYSEALKAAAAIELVQSAFLTHDDIMDQDKSRRGHPTIFYQYQLLGEEQTLTDPLRFGESMGICAGDILFFMAFDTLSGLKIGPETRLKILNLVYREVMGTCVAQMQDVFWSNLDLEKPAEEEEIIRLYTYKTARYTFSLPLMIGALLAGQEEASGALERIGEALGVIFQIKDDELGLFGTEEQIGKPVGSDLQEGKKTLFHLYLLQDADPEEKRRLVNILKKKGEPKESDLAFVRSLIESKGIRDRIGETVSRYARQARELIHSLPLVTDKDRETLLDLMEYNLGRKS